jgi:ribonuclease J
MYPSLTIYDGANGIGGNEISLEESGRGVFLDFGKNFGKYGLFYEEFLKNCDTCGIHDLVYLNLLPKLNIYRPDLIPSDLSLSQYPALNVAAVLLRATPIWIMLATWEFCERICPL